MINQQQVAQILAALSKKNNQDSGSAPMADMSQPQEQPLQVSGGKQPSMLGFLGGLGDTKNPQGGIDPSWLTQINQVAMKQMGQSDGQQPFPWQQQPQSQQMGQGSSNGMMKMGSALMSLFM